LTNETAREQELMKRKKWLKTAVLYAVTAAIILIALFTTGKIGGEQELDLDDEGSDIVQDPFTVEEYHEDVIPATVDAGLQYNYGFVWKVPPYLEYEEIWYCRWCEVYYDNNFLIINPETGLTDNEQYGGHGASIANFVYDEKKDLYGWYVMYDGGEDLKLCAGKDFPFEVKEWFQEDLAQGLVAFQKIDSKKIIKPDFDNEKYSYDLSDAYISKEYAIANGITFITDFIYDDLNRWGAYIPYYIGNSIINVRLDGNWLILDKDGCIVIPFYFEDIFLIDDNFVFAKINGKYGILDVGKTAEIVGEIEFIENGRAGRHWSEADCPFEPNEHGIEVPVGVTSISSKEEALKIGLEIIENHRNNTMSPDYILFTVEHYTAENTWVFYYSIEQRDVPFEEQMIGEGIGVAVDGNSGEILKAWAEE